MILLILLASPVLAGLGIPLRARLVWLLALIAVYVRWRAPGRRSSGRGRWAPPASLPLLAGRPASRAYALLLAAAATLLLNPRVCGDPGWQLSFAAVLGIFLLAAPIRDRSSAPARRRRARLRRALAEGAALTVSATLATAPADLAPLRRPPGRHAGREPPRAARRGAGDVARDDRRRRRTGAGAPVEPLNGRRRAACLRRPGGSLVRAPAWAVPRFSSTGRWRCSRPTSCWPPRRRWRCAGLAQRSPPAPPSAAAGARVAAGALVALACCWRALWPGGGGCARRARAGGLRIEVLDVGQGDAILLQPAAARGGPRRRRAARRRARGEAARGGRRPARAPPSSPTTSPTTRAASRDPRRAARAPPGLRAPARGLLRRPRAGAGAVPYRVAEGSEIRSGRCGWRSSGRPRPLDRRRPARSEPALARPAGPLAELRDAADRRRRGRGGADRPRPVDVLKVSHHGSEDAGLGALLERTLPRLAVISVGEANPFRPSDSGDPRHACAEHRVTVRVRTIATESMSLVIGR